MAALSADAAGRLRRAGTWLGGALLVIVFAVCAAATWRKWPDLLVDFGRELYVPWQLSQGRVLYRDIAWLFGPFSQYLNALAFAALGASFSTLIGLNLAVLAALTCLVYATFRQACDQMTATLTALALLLAFGFSQYLPTGNYNFVSPYSHEATHGIVLSVAMLFCLARFAAHRRPAPLLLGGLWWGLAVLTRAEVALAASVAVLCGLVSIVLIDRGLTPATGKAVRGFFLTAPVPSVIFLLYFWRHMPLPEAVRAAGGSWTALVGTGIASNRFYRVGMGLDEPLANAWLAVRMFLEIIGFAFVIAVLDLAAGLLRHRRALVGGGVCAAALAALVLLRDVIPWFRLLRCLPLIALLGCAVSARLLVKHRHEPGTAARIVPHLAWNAFALVLLGKIFLRARLEQYGFYLAMPATLTLVSALVWALPLWLRHRFGGGGVCRWLAVIGLAVGMFAVLRQSHRLYALKTLPVGQGGDRIVTYDPRVQPAGIAVTYALGQIERVMPGDATFVVLPEGVMLNYLSRRRNPTPFVNFMPIELLAFGEDAILASLRSAAPDFVVLVHKDAREYGVGYFGTDPRYGRSIMEWVRARYREVWLIGAPPLTSPAFGISILARQGPGTHFP